MFDLIFGPASRLAAAEALLGALHRLPSISDDRLVAIMEGSDRRQLLLLDVREEEEFMVSRIDGAVRIDPDTDAATFRERFADGIEGKTVVACCSIGERSAVLLERIGSLCLEMGALEALNLRGGLFRWHANGRPLVDDHGLTGRIHPFNGWWGMLLATDNSAL